MSLRKTAIALAALAGLAACGDTVGEQALSGGAIGAGAGAVLDADIGTSIAVGAVGSVLYCQTYPSRCN